MRKWPVGLSRYEPCVDDSRRHRSSVSATLRSRGRSAAAFSSDPIASSLLPRSYATSASIVQASTNRGSRSTALRSDVRAVSCLPDSIGRGSGAEVQAGVLGMPLQLVVEEGAGAGGLVAIERLPRLRRQKLALRTGPAGGSRRPAPRAWRRTQQRGQPSRRVRRPRGRWGKRCAARTGWSAWLYVRSWSVAAVGVD